MHSNQIVPFSPLIIYFVQKKESDFNLFLLMLLAEFYHSNVKKYYKPNQYSKVGTHFSQMYSLCLDQQNTEKERQVKDNIAEEITFKLKRITLFDNLICDTLFMNPSRYVSKQIDSFFEMLMKTQIKVYQTVGKKKVLKTVRVCVEHLRDKDPKKGWFTQVSMHPYLFCQTLPYTFYYRPPLQKNYWYACRTLGMN